MPTNEAKSLLWEIYQDIGLSCAASEMTDAQKAQLVVDLRKAAELLEEQLPVYN